MHVTGDAREEKENGAEKEKEIKKGHTFHKFGEKNQLRVLRSSANPKQDEYKENQT